MRLQSFSPTATRTDEYIHRVFDEALVLLSALRILDTKDGNPPEKLSLSSTFKRSMRQALTGGYVAAFARV